MTRNLIVPAVFLFSAAAVFLNAQAPPLPGTSMDRVGFPTNYQQTFKRMYALDNNQNRQIRVIWANDVAQAVDASQPWTFPYGSVLLFESWAPQLNDAGDPVLDADGRFIATTLQTIFAMRKEKGFGTEYGPIRNGEWEYVSYNPDGSFATAPSASGGCALCHLTGSSAPLTSKLPPINAANDFVFRADQMFRGGNGAMPAAVMQNYLFVPNTIHVKAGTPLTIYNDDGLVHTIAAGDFRSDFLGTGGSFTMKFDTPGEVPIRCTLHSRMRGTIIVDPPDDTAAAASNSPHSR